MYLTDDRIDDRIDSFMTSTLSHPEKDERV